MTVTSNSLWNVQNALRFAKQVLRYSSTFLYALLCPEAVLAARLLATESRHRGHNFTHCDTAVRRHSESRNSGSQADCVAG